MALFPGLSCNDPLPLIVMQLWFMPCSIAAAFTVNNYRSNQLTAIINDFIAAMSVYRQLLVILLHYHCPG
jgi:hypothetical protein